MAEDCTYSAVIRYAIVFCKALVNARSYMPPVQDHETIAESDQWTFTTIQFTPDIVSECAERFARALVARGARQFGIVTLDDPHTSQCIEPSSGAVVRVYEELRYGTPTGKFNATVLVRYEPYLGFLFV